MFGKMVAILCAHRIAVVNLPLCGLAAQRQGKRVRTDVSALKYDAMPAAEQMFDIKEVGFKIDFGRAKIDCVSSLRALSSGLFGYRRRKCQQVSDDHREGDNATEPFRARVRHHVVIW